MIDETFLTVPSLGLIERYSVFKNVVNPPLPKHRKCKYNNNKSVYGERF